MQQRNTATTSTQRNLVELQLLLLCTGLSSHSSKWQDLYVKDVDTLHTKAAIDSAQPTIRCVCLAAKSGTSQRFVIVSTPSTSQYHIPDWPTDAARRHTAKWCAAQARAKALHVSHDQPSCSYTQCKRPSRNQHQLSQLTYHQLWFM